MVERELPKLLTAVRFRSPALSLGGLLLMGAWVAGCTPYYGEPAGRAAPPTAGLYHRVERGETLWSISRRYGVPVRELARANRVSDASHLESGQRLWIPGAPAPSEASPRSSSRAARPGAPAGSEGFVWPVQGRVVSIFGTRKSGRVNKGIDIQAAPGTQVHASRTGTVSFVHEGLPGFGKTIIVEHGEGFASVYAHVGEILVRPGDAVSQRQVIARLGGSAKGSTAGLHFQIRRRQKAQNPLHYLP